MNEILKDKWGERKGTWEETVPKRRQKVWVCLGLACGEGVR